MISTGDMKRGATIELDGRVYQVMEFDHIKMGRGSAQMRMKLRDVRRGDTIERSFQAGEKWPRVRVERVRDAVLLRRRRHHALHEHRDLRPGARSRPTRSATRRTTCPRTATCDVLFLGDEPIGIELPASVVLTVTKCEPGVKGDTAPGRDEARDDGDRPRRQRPALHQRGRQAQGQHVTGEYQERA